MIDLYTSGTPNVQKIHILLHELELPYTMHLVNVYRGEQFKPEFLAINPNGKVPAIVDRDGPGGRPYTVFESGAILFYLADKARSPLLPNDPIQRYDILQWLMWQMAGLGPMLGQFNHFKRFAPGGNEYSDQRYTSEARRLYDVLETRLAKSPYIAGEHYSIADIAVFPWIRQSAKRFSEDVPFMKIGNSAMPNIARWFREIERRPAVARAIVTIDANPSPSHTATPDDLDRFFGRGAHAKS